MTWLPRAELLTFEEIERVARVLRRALRRSTRIRLTGGEPTVRAHLPVLVAPAGRACGVDLALTTNGATLGRHGRRPGRGRAAPHQHLAATRCGRDRFAAMTRRDELAQVLDGIDAALAAGLRPGEGQRAC